MEKNCNTDKRSRLRGTDTHRRTERGICLLECERQRKEKGISKKSLKKKGEKKRRRNVEHLKQGGIHGISRSRLEENSQKQSELRRKKIT